METVKQALADVEKFEKYVLIKSDAITYLAWAFLAMIGTIASYFIEVFGRALKVNEDYLGPLHGMIWYLVLGAALLSPSVIIPFEERSAIKKDEKFKVLNRNIGLAWFFSFILGISTGLVVSSVFAKESGFLWGIMISVGLGNFITGLLLRAHTKGPLGVGIFILLLSYLVLFTPFPYYYFYFGITIAIPYYVLGAYYYLRVLPKVLHQG